MIPCCDHCGCNEINGRFGHDDTCQHGCNDPDPSATGDDAVIQEIVRRSEELGSQTEAQRLERFLRRILDLSAEHGDTLLVAQALAVDALREDHMSVPGLAEAVRRDL